MVYLRRSLKRLFRTKSLAILTIFIIFLYIFKMMNSSDDEATVNVIKNMLFKNSEYFIPNSLKKIDWHNFAQMDKDANQNGIGEQGKPSHMPKEESDLEERLYAVNGFNGALSDKIALNRSLPDIRHKLCKTKLYIESLPTVSIVVPFHNEHWSTLLRTAYSALNRSPPGIIKEVFLVDDASTKDFLKKKLDDYIKKNLPKVKVIRLPERSGLITARLAGAKEATGDVLIFLDSHTEANINWLPPLLEPIALNYKTVVCPFIDVVAHDSFEYRAQDEGARGAFDWEFYYKRLPLMPKDKANMPEPFESPVMAGGLFAISRVFFWELGGYDPGLDIWGGEQYEISFKIWQCGGRMVDAPCSRVGHIYRKFAPFPNPGHGDFVGKNYRRVAEVWMDEYAQYLYKRRPQYLNIDTGDIEPQKALRRNLQCKPFKWFMTQVAYDLIVKYPVTEPKPYAEGRIRPRLENSLCVDTRHGEQLHNVTLTRCGVGGGEQAFVFTWHKDIRCKERSMCWDLPVSAPGSPVVLYSCHLSGGNQMWRYKPDTYQVKHSSGVCLSYSKSPLSLHTAVCDPAEGSQQFTVDTVHSDVMAHYDDVIPLITGPVEPWRE